MSALHLLDPLFLIKTVGLLGVFAIVFTESGLFFGFFFPGDSLLFTAGVLASQGFFSLLTLIVGCIVAAIAGSAVGYEFGRFVGPAIFSREDTFFFHKKHLEEANAYFGKHGRKTVILGRFLPVVRTFVPIVAGVGDMPYNVFMFFNTLGAAAWTLLSCGAGFYLGKAIPNAERYILPIVITIIAVSFLPAAIKLLKKKQGSA